ncbi:MULTISPECIES: hypothetical protein [Stenotrophomonas maltophilia group]|uniref:hypothetical protein n=1 Tax=Stenotrophomonas maltophilia group TaxID=995085 RepID=UPI002555BEFB|nr:hypothetical protein [Stenotrophomonas maltophilia]EKU9958670.1 hypothetical protein [Stenotrophomonas maltophilia]EKU9961641.1 hypothetical protein [Stenotrophomonas maltophilia]EKU9986463.1 hypothetical protein [Stenotrophomonas maltophilia]EKU9988093.1 hypothetical protein [Stenotrophomonas maltophilia]
MYIADTVHFHDDSERDYYAVLGRYISAWGRFENGIYDLLAAAGGPYREMLKKLGEHSLPPEFKPGFMPFSTKIKNLKKCIEACPALWHPRDRVADLLEWAENEAAARHHLIHGVDQIFLKRSPFATYMYKGENSDPLSSNVAHGMDFTIESLAARYDRVGDACMNLAALYLEIAEAIAQLGKEINPPSAPSQHNQTAA